MDEFEKFIKDHRGEFDRREPLDGHEERFYSKAVLIRSARAKRLRRYSLAAVAAVFAIIVATPFLHKNMIINRSFDAYDYNTIIGEKERVIKNLAEKLENSDRLSVLNTLEQLTGDAVPFESQIPEYLNAREKKKLMKKYYEPKIEGVEKLIEYVSEINK
jgi:hypothetical protein